MNIGCHVSIAGGIDQSPKRAADLGCECFQIFTRSPQGGKAPELTEELIKNFKILNTKYSILNTYIHTPYYINFASANNRIRFGSSSVVREELERGKIIGAKYVLTHLGSAKEMDEKQAQAKVIEMLKKTLVGFTGETKLLLENSAGAGKIIGDDLRELLEIIKAVDHPSLVGICLDTQHSFASGYDWRDFKKTLKIIDEEIGLDKIKLFHVNDSLTDFNSKRDRHAHIGKGQIGLEAFRNIVTFAKKKDIDLILETEHDEVKKDIEILKSFR